MPRKTDRLYVTQTEHSGVYGQHTAGNNALSKQSADSTYQPIPYTSCAISLQSWSNPVCDRTDGTIYELTNVIPWLKKHNNISPATGNPLKASDLVTLHFHKNEATNAFHDPISFKTFNESTHLVAVGTSGNVFAYDTIQQLNVKAKYWQDLLTGEDFTRKDLITLQDPNDVSKKNVSNLHHVQKGVSVADLHEKDTDEVNVGATGSASSLIKSLKKKKDEEKSTKDQAGQNALQKLEDARQASKAQHHGTTSTGLTAASFTSSSLTPRTKTEHEIVNQEEVMYEDVKRTNSKGYVRLTTNFGPLNLELHCDKAPKTCYNFLSLCRKGYYTDTTFHRNIPGFMVQGGDPTGTGRGGESMWGKSFGDELGNAGAFRHTARGCVSMANRGPDTNGSQFFITYAAKPHLDKKHTVFGQLVDSPSATLDALEKVPTESGTDRPLRTIRILDAQIYSDPFEDYQERLQKKIHRNDESEVAKREEKRRKREQDRTTWFGTNLGAKGQSKDDEVSGADDFLSSLQDGASSGVGRYIAQGKTSNTAKKSEEPEIGIARPQKRKAGGGGGFGDFSGW